MRRLRSLVAAVLLIGLVGFGGKAQVSRAGTASEKSAVRALFNLGEPDNAPFPTDRFTVADDRNLTRRRVNLPKPTDCIAYKSECEDVDVLNQLDGFSLRPRVTIPFDGAIDPATVQGNVFFVSIGDTTDHWTDSGPDSMPTENLDRENLRKRKGFGQVSGINQIVWDHAHTRARCEIGPPA